MKWFDWQKVGRKGEGLRHALGDICCVGSGGAVFALGLETVWGLSPMWLQIALLAFSFISEGCLYWAVIGSVGCYLCVEMRVSRSGGQAELVRNAILWVGRISVNWLTEKAIFDEVGLVLMGQLCVYLAWLHSHYMGKWDLLRTCIDGVVILSKEKTIVAANQQAMALLQSSSIPHMQQLFSTLLTRLAASQTPISDLLLIHGITIEVREARYPTHSTLFLRDFTHIPALQTSHEHRRQVLLSSVSHQLRTPTNAIVNICEELADSANLSRKEQVTLRFLLSSSKLLLSSVNDFMDCALMESGGFELRKGPFRLEEMVKECVGLVEAQCVLKGISLVVRYDRQLPLIAYSDQWRLRQVMLNLLSNALKFTLKGSIEVTALFTHSHQMRLIVKDTGIGIPQEALQSLLSLLNSASDCTLGLGLANVLVKSLGGKPIQVWSKQGSGSEFKFDVDISELAVETAERLVTGDQDESCECEDMLATPQLPYVQDFHDAEVQVLIVDDNEFNRVVLQRILSANGYKCHQAFTGLQALTAVRKREVACHPYKVVLMDLDMPEMDGITATRELRGMCLRGDLRAMPSVIACSAYSSAERQGKCMEAGMTHYLEKPVARDALLRLVSRLCPLMCSLQD